MKQVVNLLHNFVFVFCILFFSATEAQISACSSDATIQITFPENDSPTLPTNDSSYTQAIFTSGIKPFNVVIDPDPQDTTNQYKFNDYFSHQWNSETNSYIVRMINGINRDGNSSDTTDDVNILQYKISCTETAGSLSLLRILQIQILDVNDNAPSFIKAPYTMYVNELTPVGVTVFRGILAEDLDEGPNKQIFYFLTPGLSQFNFNGTQYFYLPSDQEGILSVFNLLDFESMYRQTGDVTQTFYNITVIARDNAVPASNQRSSSTPLKVIITDGDDQGPEFVYPSCIQSSQPNSKSCVRPKYLTSVYSGNSSEINLDLKPDPPDSSNPSSSVYMLMQDRDTLNSNVTCTIRLTEPAGYESYFTTRSSLYSGKQYRCEIIKRANTIFNRANFSSLEIVIEAVEQSANLRVDYATVVMSVDLFNLNPPIIAYNSNTGFIYENSPVGSRVYSDAAANTTLLKLTFTDPDRSATDPPSQFDITVSSGPFSVMQDGYVQLNNAVLDYETNKQYTFTVTITKTATPRYSASVSLTVNVLDLNDNHPVVTAPDSYIVSVPQGNYASSPRMLVSVQATDVDFGPTVYSLSHVVPSNGTNKFIVTRPSGTMTLQGSVIAGEIYTVYVTVADQGNPVRSVEAVVVVTVTPLTNQSPSFSANRYTIYVSEGVPVSSSLFTLPVTDPDTPISSLSFSLSTESPQQTNSFFVLNGLNLNNSRTFDRESIPEHNITVTVRDPEGNTAQTVVTVKVMDINDNDPIFTSTSYTFTVAEGQPVGTFLGSVTATDMDQPNTPNSAVAYSIVQAVDSNLFTISPTDGQLTTNFVFDYEAKKQYVIFVKASDYGSPSRASVIPVTINITDINDNIPLFEETTKEVSVYENENNALVLSIKASDADSVPNINFVLRNIGSSNDANSFTVATVGNEARITVVGSLDYETKNLYNFTLTTTDGQGSSNVFAKVTAIVHVLDKNDNSPVIAPFNTNVNVLENVPVGYVLVNISATDADLTAPYNQLIYKISSTSPNNNLFSIITDTGKLVVANSLQQDRNANVYTATVTVSDVSTSPLYSSATVTVTIIRNRPPVFNPSSITATSASENLSVNTVIATVTATDPDTGITPQFAGLNYSLVPDSRINNLFSIDSTSGSISIKSNLASVTDNSFVLGVIATDNGGLTATATVTIPMNRSLYDPEFTQLSYTREIPENFALGDSVVQLLAHDLDANSPWNSLTLTIDSSSVSQQYFQVNDAGLLTLKQPLTSNNISEFNMIISVKDKGSPPRSGVATANVKVTVTRNYYNPVFSNDTYRITIPEYQSVGSSIIKVGATDADTKYNRVVYSIDGDQTAASYFAINPVTGDITLKQSVNNTQISPFVIRVVATDDGPVPKTGTALVFVDVSRNYRKPEWIAGTSNTVNTFENTALGTSIFKLSAVDNDFQPPNNQIDYYITSGGAYFVVNSTTGDVTIKAPLYTDASNVSKYQVTFVARDRGTPSLQSDPFTLTVNVGRNYFSPQWIATPYSFQLNTPVTDNKIIQTLTARDDDAIPFNQMTFDIIPYPGFTSFFNFVNPGATSVELRVSNANLILSDTRTVYYLYVRVQDNGLPRKYDIALVTIYFNRNFNTPSFPVTTKTVNITENTPPGDLISTCTATDSDPGVNGQIVYTSASSLPASNYFQVLPNTGQIILHRDLHQDRSSSYMILLTAQDQSTPPLSAPTTCTVTVNVYRDLYAPVFVNTPYDTTLNSNAVIGASVVRVTATDADTLSPFNTVKYEIVYQTVDGAFTVDRNTGLVTVNSTLTQSAYTIAIRAYDGGNPPLSAYNVFVVNINGNNESPQFLNPGSSDSYQKSVEILETKNVLDYITNVTATDGDSGAAGRVSYSLVGNSQAVMYFQINPDNGIISLKSSLLQDTANQYILYITARDNDPQPRQSTTTATVTVNVYRNIYAPVSTLNCTKFVDENLAIGQIVTTVNATDADKANTFETVRYEIIGDGDAPGFFRVDIVTGSVTLRSLLSSSPATALYLRVRAYDNGVPAKTATITCTISVNKNLNTPVWSTANPNSPQFTYTINEDQALYVPFGLLSATDTDSQSPYNQLDFFYNPTSQSALDYFRVTREGEVAAIKSLMVSSSNSYMWTMGLRDRGTPLRTNSVTATVTVNIVRNNNEPAITNCPSTLSLRENSTVGTKLFQVIASDLDPANTPYGNITLRIIGDDNATTFFNLDSQNFVVLSRVLSTDNNTRYQLRIQVADQGTPPKSSVCVTSLNVERNLAPPRFTIDFYDVTILENQPIAPAIVTLTATDTDRISPYNQISYSFGNDILSSRGIDYFMVRSYSVYILRDLRSDVSKATNYKFTVFATDGGGLQATATVNVTVIRNTAPVITNLDRNITIYHNISTGTIVFDVDVNDTDTVSPFNEEKFSITGERASFNYFRIDENTGIISLTQSLLGFGPDMFIVTVRVCDGGDLCNTKTLTISVTRNFVAPTFTQPNYEITIFEDAPVLTSILTVQAIDSDLAPPYNTFNYRLQQPNDRFFIESDSGIIRVKRPLTGENFPDFTFYVVAEDGGNKVSVPISVKVNIIRNNYGPEMSKTSCDGSMNANISPGTVVGSVSATDNDTDPHFGTASIRYSAIGDDGAPSFLSVNSLNGQITVLSGISSNSADIYKLRIEARDQLGKTAVKVCTFTVTRNLNDPSFAVTSYSATILETCPVGNSVIQASIVDADTSPPSNQPNFTLAGNAQCVEYFQIGVYSGIISVNKDLRLNPLKPSTYTCTITASDRGIPPRNAVNTATATISVRYNTAPYFDKDYYTVNVSRTITYNTPLVNYIVSDNDLDAPFNSLIVYISGGPDARFFALNQNNQVVIKNTADMALETDTKYEIIITVVDGGSPPLNDTAVVMLYVNRNVETPVCTPQNTVSINYTQPLGVTIAILNATDKDPMVQAVAKDGGFPSLSSTCTVMISIITDSDKLAFNIANDTVTIPETTPVNTNIRVLSAKPTPGITYSVIGTDTAPTYFDINALTGQVYVKTDLRNDLTKRKQYILYVKAIKTFQVTTQEATATLTIYVDRNLNTPVIVNGARIETTINDDAFIGSPVILINASDADNDRLLYTVQSPTNSSDYFYVSQTTGLISVARLLTAIPNRRVEFIVIVSDQSVVDPKSASVTVVINVVGDQLPYFVNPNTYRTTVNFNQPVNSSIFQVTATDPDLKGPLVYESSCGLLSTPSFFQVNNTNGLIYLRADLGIDTSVSYQLCLVAYDSQRPNNRATATMTILINRNPNKPDFPQKSYSQTVRETADFGTLMFSISAIDLDGQNVEYRVLSATPSVCNNYFNLHPNSGSFTTSGNLYLTRPNANCNFQFTARDVATPSQSTDTPATGVITFIRNNYTPVFPSAEYTITVDESLTFPSQVFDVNATDGDAPDPFFGAIEYVAIGDDTASGLFGVDITSGVINLTNSLRNDNTARYNVRIVARDNGVPRLSSTVVVHIDIRRNNYPPVINNNQGSISITIFEDDPINNPLFRFNCTDQDRPGPQQSVTWSINFNSDGDKAYFYINQLGEVYISVPLYFDDSNKSPYNFTVTATNNDGSGKSGSIFCTVNVNRNLYPPEFTQDVYTVSNVSSLSAVPLTINANILAADKDSFSRNQVQRYEIINDGVYSTLFSINSSTGQLSLVQQISQRTENVYKIDIRAVDGGKPPLTDEATVIVSVNQNSARPAFIVGNQSLTLFEDQNIAVITRVTAKDDDLQAPYNQLSFTQVTVSSYFGTDSLGQVYLKSPLNIAGTPDSFTLQVRVCDQAPQPLCSLQDAYIFINVIRNHPPYFLSTPYTRNLQTLSVGQNVLNATARDDDKSTTRFGQISFDLIGDDGAENRFAIDRLSGIIRATSASGGSQQSPFRLRIRVCDGGYMCNVTVGIVAISSNQYAPVLDKPNYSQRIPETQPYGDTIITVLVTDQDATAPNNQFECELLNGTVNDQSLSCFAVNPTFCLIFAKRSLTESPCNISDQYNFRVRSSDKGNPVMTSSPSDVVVFIDRNQYPPNWDKLVYSFTIPMNSPLNTVVGTIRATDLDPLTPFGTLSYSIIGGANGNSYFTISQVDNNNVNVILSNQVSSTPTQDYQILVLVQDSGLPRRQNLTEVNIHVNFSLNAPYFTKLSYYFETYEHVSLGETIGNLQGADNDTFSTWKDYYFRLLPTHAYFAVSPSGSVYAQRDLELDTTYTEKYTLTAQIYDGGVPSLNGSQLADITIQVFRNKNCPKFSNLPNSITINRNTTAGTVIFTVQASDSDTNIRYNRTTLQSSNVNQVLNYFDLDVSTGAVKVLPSLGSHSATLYTLTVFAVDGYCDLTIGTLTVNVVRNLSPPQWSKNNDSITVLEIQDTGSSIYNLGTIASDSDSASFTFEFAPGSPNTNLFYFDTQGRVYLSRTLLARSGDPYQVQFRLKDDGGLYSSVFTLTVNVIRNHAPVLTISPSSITLNSSQAVNSEVFRCSGIDSDTVIPFSQTGFYLMPDYPVSKLFTVDEQTCAVKLINSLNSDAQSNYTLRIQIRDGGTPRLEETKTLIIYVRRNLAPPIFSSLMYFITILETKPVGETILSVTATDSDVYPPNNQVTYAIVTPTAFETYFGINHTTGAVYSKIWQVYYPNRTTTTFTFQVSAVDNGSPQLMSSNNATVTVNVIRNTAPYFTNTNSYNTTISKNHSEGTSVFTVTFGDNDQVDPFNHLALTIRGEGNSPSFFDIAANGSIILKTGTNLATSSVNNFTIRVQVQDGGIPPLSAEALVYINVQRNFNPPSLQSITVPIPYTASRGYFITKLNATDADITGPEATIRYQITGGGQLNGINYFFLNPETGELNLTDTTNLVNINNFIMSVRAYDLGTPSLSTTAIVTVVIQKDSDTLTIPNYSWTIAENVANASLVGTVQASTNVGVTYSVVGYPSATNFFGLNGANGQIVVIRNLTGDLITLYTMIVRASRNTGLTVQTADSTVLINVLRNLNAPLFSQNNYVTTIPDITAIGTSILNVSATDADGDVPEYSFIPNSGDYSFFYIHPRTGVISLIKSLIGTTADKYTFQVQVRDNSRPEKFGVSNVTINIVKDNLPPQFSQSVYNGAVNENTPNGTIVVTVTASDADLRGQLNIIVDGISTAPAFFGLGTVTPVPGNNQATANILLQDSAYLRKDFSPVYLLRLITYDTAYPNTRATSTVSIISTKNPNPPVFDLPNYETTIYATLTAGSVIFNNISATDRDGDSPLRFTIIGDASALTYYEVNPDTAVIRLKNSLLSSNQIKDIIQLSVSDQKNPAKFGFVNATVNIIRDISPPQFINIPANITITVHESPGKEIFVLSATDPDIKGNLFYTLISGYADFFNVSVSGLGNSAVGRVYLVLSLREDALRQTHYQLRFRVIDDKFPTSYDERVLTVNVNTDPNSPQCRNAVYQTSIDGNAKIGSVLYTVNAVDADGDVILYMFDSNSTDQEDRRYFYIEPYTGNIKLIDDLSTSGITSFIFTIVASDQGYPAALTCATTISLNVTTDKAPYFLPVNYSWNIAETAFNTSAQLSVYGFDDDRQGNLHYRIIGNYSSPRYFGVRRNNSNVPASSATIYVQEDIKPDNDLVYQILIVVYDDARPKLSGTATVTAYVNRNPSGPDFSLNNYQATFHELEPVGYNPVNVSAVDADGDYITYSFLRTGVDQKPLQYFDIHPVTGKISVVKRLVDDPDKLNGYVLTVLTTDNRYPPNVRQATVTLNVTRNRIHPVFINTPYIVPALSENTAVGSVVYTTVSAIDQDARGPLVYVKISNTSAAYYFNIHSSSAAITLANTLLEGTSETYQFYVQAYDPEYPEDFIDKVVSLQIKRNEYAPVFEKAAYAITINETDPVGQNILTVHASDNNTADSISYVLVRDKLGGDGFSFFYIEPYTGNIYLRRPLTESMAHSYTLVVSATDSGNPSKSSTVDVVINVQQIAKPVFSVSQSTIMLPENTTIGTSIFKFDATKPGATIVYELVGVGIAPYLFAVSSNGTVTMKNSLNFFNDLSYNLVVNAFDPAYPQFKKSAQLTTYITRNNHTTIIDELNGFVDDHESTSSQEIQTPHGYSSPLYSSIAPPQNILISQPSVQFFIGLDSTTGLDSTRDQNNFSLPTEQADCESCHYITPVDMTLDDVRETLEISDDTSSYRVKEENHYDTIDDSA